MAQLLFKCGVYSQILADHTERNLGPFSFQCAHIKSMSKVWQQSIRTLWKVKSSFESCNAHPYNINTNRFHWGLGKFCVRPGRHIIIDSQKWNVIQYCLQAYNVQKAYIHTGTPNLILQKKMDFSSAKSTRMYSLTRKTPRCFVFTRPRGSIVNTKQLTAFTLFQPWVFLCKKGSRMARVTTNQETAALHVNCMPVTYQTILSFPSESVSICFYLDIEEIPVWVYIFSTCRHVYCFPLIWWQSRPLQVLLTKDSFRTIR